MSDKSHSSQINAKFISVKIENFLERTNTVNIEINFLGSSHPASKHPGAGEQYGNHLNVYYNCKLQGDKHTLMLTFSGPTALDIKKPNIKSITQEAKEILNDLIPNISLLKKNIVIDIQGHSRGGIVANNIHDWLSSINLGNSIRLGKLNIADPYAGPINRLVNEKNNNFDKISNNTFVPTNKVVVYTVAEKRFGTPAQSLKSDIIVFTDVSHDKTKYIAKHIFDSNTYKDGLYICADPNGELKKMYNSVDNNPTEKEQMHINKWLKQHIEPINKTNMYHIFSGAGNFRKFSYNKISSDGRRELFYTALAQFENGQYQTQIKNFLEGNNHKIMWKKVEKNLKKLGIQIK